MSRNLVPVRRRSLGFVLLFVLAITPGAAGCGGCPAALSEGVLTEQSGDLVVAPPGGGRPERVIWPAGLGVREDGDTLVVSDIFGSVKAREGDFVRLGGGEAEDGVWRTCGMFEVGPTPAT
jgi:hypothetical protein